MKTLCLLLILLIFFGNAGAQMQRTSSALENYITLSLEAGTFFASRPGHDITLNFPYTVTSFATGGTDKQTFDGSLRGKFTSPAYMGGLNLGFVLQHSSIDVGLGLFREDGGDHGWYMKGGYGYIVPLGGLLLKPAIDLYYLIGKDKIGTIDNNQKEISLLGYTAYDQFTVKSDDGEGSTVENTYNADHLDVNYRRFNFLANPKIVLATRPKGRLVLSLELGWMFQLSQRCNMQLEQTSTSTQETYTVAKIPLENNGSLNGAYAGINIGVRL
jgi:hypothetical protein